MPEIQKAADRPTPPPSSPAANGVDRFLGITERGSTLGREARGGFTAFFTTAHLLVLNPLVPGGAEDEFGHRLDAVQLATATAWVAAVMTVVMGVSPATSRRRHVPGPDHTGPARPARRHPRLRTRRPPQPVRHVRRAHRRHGRPARPHPGPVRFPRHHGHRHGGRTPRQRAARRNADAPAVRRPPGRSSGPGTADRRRS